MHDTPIQRRKAAWGLVIDAILVPRGKITDIAQQIPSQE